MFPPWCAGGPSAGYISFHRRWRLIIWVTGSLIQPSPTHSTPTRFYACPLQLPLLTEPIFFFTSPSPISYITACTPFVSHSTMSSCTPAIWICHHPPPHPLDSKRCFCAIFNIHRGAVAVHCRRVPVYPALGHRGHPHVDRSVPIWQRHRWPEA